MISGGWCPASRNGSWVSWRFTTWSRTQNYRRAKPMEKPSEKNLPMTFYWRLNCNSWSGLKWNIIGHWVFNTYILTSTRSRSIVCVVVSSHPQQTWIPPRVYPATRLVDSWMHWKARETTCHHGWIWRFSEIGVPLVILSIEIGIFHYKYL